MILLRPATLGDAELLRAWRNDVLMRKNSFHSSRVGPKEHGRWLRESLKSERRRIYIARFIGDPPLGKWIAVGEGRLDFNGEIIEFDVEVSFEHRGKGYGAQIISALVAKAREWKPGAPLVAHVKAFNTASLRAFLRAGFAVKGKRRLELEML